MARLARGERDALAPLMERHYRRLYRVALAYLRDPDAALDAVQETFVKAFERADTWRAGSDVGPWLTRIAVNASIDGYRRSRRARQHFEPLDDADHHERLADPAPAPDRHVLGRELGERVGAALATLPPTQRSVFVLRHYEELSLEEIARTLGLSLGTVKSSLHRALGRLRPRLAGLRR